MNGSGAMTNTSYRLVEWVMDGWDIFLSHPARDLRKVPPKPDLTVVDYACGPERSAKRRSKNGKPRKGQD
jgi:hypothetical protein